MSKQQTDITDLATKAAAMAKQTVQKAPEIVDPPVAKPAVESAQAPAPEPPKAEIAKPSAIPVRRGRIFKPRRIVIHGSAGCGKTTLAADIDGALFFDLNNGSEMLDINRYVFRPNDTQRGHVPNSLEEFMTGLRVVHANPTGISHLVVDLYSDLERLVLQSILLRDEAAEGKGKLHSMESYGFGKGKQILYDEVRAVLSAFDKITTKGIGVVLIAHSMVVKRNNPNGADYDVNVIRALDVKEVSMSSYIYGWADEVAYMHFDDKAAKLGGKGREKGVTGGNRVLEFDHSATWDAKARLPLPKSVKVASANPWQFMRQALDRAYRATPAEIRREILDELTRIGDPELAVSIDLAVKNVGDNLDKLTAYMQQLRRTPTVEQDSGTDTREEI